MEQKKYKIYGYVFNFRRSDINDKFIELFNETGRDIFITDNVSEELKEMVGKEIVYRFKFDSYKRKLACDVDTASYSAKGPSDIGIIKPDIVAPGSFIISASSYNTPVKNHGSGNDILHSLAFRDGTSMSTPNVAGIASLISQYFNDGKYINYSIRLHPLALKAILIGSASRKDGSSTPDCISGHGLIDISTVLPFDNSFGIRISETMIMDKMKNHQIGKIKVIRSKNVSLRIILCSYDVPLAMESIVSIKYDLDLIVISPTGKIYLGNGYTKDTEHFTLNEKVIVPVSELEDGYYYIHVITNNDIE